MNRRIGAVVLVAGGAVAVAAVIGARTSILHPAGHETALHVVAGLTFVAVGVFALSRPQSTRVGVMMCAIGFAWFVPDLANIPSSAAVSIAVLEGTIAYALLGHLFISFPTGRLRSGVDRAVVIAVYAWTLLGNLIPDTFFAPPELPCGGCAQNLVVLHRDAAAHTLAVNMHQIGNMVVTTVVLAVVIAHFVRATPPARRVLAPVALAAGPVELAVISLNVVGVVGSFDWLTGISPVLTPIAVMLLPFGFLAGLLRARIAHGALGRLVLDLGAGEGRGELRDALAGALHDPSLELAYWRADADAWVDADGAPVALPRQSEGRAVTIIEQGDAPIAALTHDASLLNDPWLLDDVCAAAALALDNERLRADLAAQLAEVRASRSRIVEAGDAARLRIERDLHDGAQQRLVSVLLTLKTARAEVPDGAAELATVLDEAIDGQQSALAELRELASGIHPAVLTDGGLGPALRTLATRSQVEVALREVPERRLPAPIEAAAYFVVCEALTNSGKHADARCVTVSVSQHDSTLLVEIVDDGAGGADIAAGSGLRGLADRVAALDGRLEVISPAGLGTTIRATIPCA